MILVVAGPTTSIFIRLVAKIDAIGISTLYLLFSANTPLSDDGLADNPSVEGEPGYVRARTTGRAVCSPKYIGKMACWRVEN